MVFWQECEEPGPLGGRLKALALFEPETGGPGFYVCARMHEGAPRRTARQ